MLSVQLLRSSGALPKVRRPGGSTMAARVAAVNRKYCRRVNSDMSPPNWQGRYSAGVQHLHEFPEERPIVVPCPRGDQVTVHDHRPIDIAGPALLGVQGALGDRRDRAAADHPG